MNLLKTSKMSILLRIFVLASAQVYFSPRIKQTDFKTSSTIGGGAVYTFIYWRPFLSILATASFALFRIGIALSRSALQIFFNSLTSSLFPWASFVSLAQSAYVSFADFVYLYSSTTISAVYFANCSSWGCISIIFCWSFATSSLVSFNVSRPTVYFLILAGSTPCWYFIISM